MRGFRDVFGADADNLTQLEASARKIFKLYSVAELRIPTVELKELFVKATGDTTDIVQKEMYAFEDAGGRLLALRPEGTPGVARAYIENNFAQTSPVQRFFYIGNMFRAERPQAGRYREFEQIGAEFLGAAAPATDAEAILLLKDIITDFGVKNYSVKINSLGCAKCRPAYRQQLIEFFSAQKDNLCDKCLSRLQKNPLRVLDCKIDGEKFKNSVPKQQLCGACANHFTEVKNLLEGKINFEADPMLVRGLDYYTGTVFEFLAGASAQNAIAGGGRYDTLIKSMGGADAAAIGWAMGAERVCAARGQNTAAQDKKVFVVCMDQAGNKMAFNLMQTLRAAGIITEGGLFDKNLKTQMKQADRSRANFAIIIGGDEVKNNTAVLKNLQSGEQKTLPITEVATSI